MTYVINKSPQGSPEWIKARAGLITASRAELARKVGGLTKQQATYVAAIKAGNSEAAALAVAGYKKKPSSEAIERALAGQPVGDWSDTSRAYAFRVAIERITGEPLDEGWSGNFFSKRGQRLEEEARMLFEARYECLVEEVGLIYTEDRRFGVSADGWEGDDAGVEIKCFLDPSKIMPILLEGDFASIRAQVLMNLWLSGRRRWHQILYVPALAVIDRDLTVITVDRADQGVEDEIEALQDDLLSLDKLVCHYQERLLSTKPAVTGTIAASAIAAPTIVAAVQALPPEALDAPPVTVLTESGAAPSDQWKSQESWELFERSVACEIEQERAAKATVKTDETGVSQVSSVTDAQPSGDESAAAQPTNQPAEPAADDGPATLSTGGISARLGFTVSTDFIEGRLGMPCRERAKAARLWRESDWPAIKDALMKHVAGLP